jgi:DNA (cytosine-5)-methyltransferase 1
MSLRYLSVCSGIEAATVAWHPLGFQPVAFSEIDPFPCAVLAHHYPTVPNWGDMTGFKDWPDANVDLFVGGTPCQSFSVAGLRAGLADPRGSLMLTYLAIAGRYRPRWLVWENVPGVLSSDDGRAFGSLLGGLAELGYGFAYRILDAQYFGLAQRRRRVFVVGHLGDWRRAAAVLFERESLSGHPAPSREAREGTAPDHWRLL